MSFLWLLGPVPYHLLHEAESDLSPITPEILLIFTSHMALHSFTFIQYILLSTNNMPHTVPGSEIHQ